MKKVTLLFVAIILMAFTSNIIAQGIPQTINYQGILKDATGVVVPNGDYNLTFKLYYAESGGAELWSEAKTINVIDGIVNTQLGSVTPISYEIFFQAIWLGITVGSENELIPRLALTCVPYSFMSMNVPDGSITATKISDSEVVKSINGLKDSINLVAGSNITISPSGNELTISAASGSGGTIGGSGTANYIPRFSGETTLANSIIYQTGGNIGIGTLTPTVKLELAGSDAKIHGLTIGRGGGSMANNVALGIGSLFSNTTGNYNTAIGLETLFNNETGSYNIAIGYNSLYHNTLGNENTAIGFGALYHNIANYNNTAVGSGAMYFSNNGTPGLMTSNTAVGFESLLGSSIPANNTGVNNTAIGSRSLRSNTDGSYNVANGVDALTYNTTGYHNSAIGVNALGFNTSGDNNTANGYYALSSNTVGDNNTAIGDYALLNSTTQNYNTGIGSSAGSYNAFSAGTFLGAYSYPNASGYIYVMGLGVNARPTASHQVRIGNSFVTSIGGYAGWTNVSDGRYKTSVQENVKGLDFVMKLRPITYQLDVNRLAADLKEDQKLDENGNIITAPDENDNKSRNEKSQIVYTGFVAQEVEKAANEVGFNFSGIDAPKNGNDFYGLRYAEFVVPLVKAVQEQQKIIEELTKRIEDLERR